MSNISHRTALAVFAVAIALKSLLLPAYFSTDFEVHRNWLAITYSLPMSQWYVDETSPWTLDYPPFFAMFEWLLSYVAKMVDPNMVDIHNLDYASEETIMFQRFSVILTDIVLAAGAWRCLRSLKLGLKPAIMTFSLILMNVGLMFVDNIHFQYNGLLFGILLLSISYILSDQCLMSALLFASLLNFKHIFLYMAPAFGIYYLNFYCVPGGKVKPSRFLKLLIVGLIPFALSFGPFWNQIPQILRRLFPFGRGLTHAYWAPNFWAIYNTCDIALAKVLRVRNESASPFTAGLVKRFDHVVLPNVSPLATFTLTTVTMLPILVKLVKADKSEAKSTFLRSVVLCSTAAFVFGWHVHEKAILMALIPLCIIYPLNVEDARYVWFLSAVGYFSLFPLLYPENLILLRYFLYLFFMGLMYANHIRLHGCAPQLTKLEWLYVLGLAGIPFYEHAVGPLLGLDEKLPFLTLLLYSAYCSLGVVYFFIAYNLHACRAKPSKAKSR